MGIEDMEFIRPMGTGNRNRAELQKGEGMTIAFANVIVTGPAIVLPCSRCNPYFEEVDMRMEWFELNGGIKAQAFVTASRGIASLPGRSG